MPYSVPPPPPVVAIQPSVTPPAPVSDAAPERSAPASRLPSPSAPAAPPTLNDLRTSPSDILGRSPASSLGRPIEVNFQSAEPALEPSSEHFTGSLHSAQERPASLSDEELNRFAATAEGPAQAIETVRPVIPVLEELAQGSDAGQFAPLTPEEALPRRPRQILIIPRQEPPAPAAAEDAPPVAPQPSTDTIPAAEDSSPVAPQPNADTAPAAEDSSPVPLADPITIPAPEDAPGVAPPPPANPIAPLPESAPPLPDGNNLPQEPAQAEDPPPPAIAPDGGGPSSEDQLTAPNPPATQSQDGATDRPVAPVPPPTPAEEAAPPSPVPAPTETTPPAPNPLGVGEAVELRADRQEYNNEQQIFTAVGRVVMRFRGAVLNADRVWVSLANRTAVAEGNVSLRRGDQVLLGDRFAYNFVQGQGNVQRARGELFLATADRDFAPALSTDITPGAGATALDTPVSSPGGITSRITVDIEEPEGERPGGFSVTELALVQGAIRRLRFEADTIDFNPDGWQASNVRVTNDPFSPPELELRSPDVTFTRLSPTQSLLITRRPRLVFDQGLAIPLLRERTILDSRRRNPQPLSFGYDERDRDGFFIEREFEIFSLPVFRLSLTPQILVQRAIEDSTSFTGANFGLVALLEANLTPSTSASARASFSSLDFTEVDENLRANVRVQQNIGTHQLRLEYSFRDRLFNGSLGFQTIEESIGAVFTSPNIVLGTTGINLSYQAGINYITARTDRVDLLPPLPRENDEISLTRFQVGAALNYPILLWAGTPLPPTPDAGLRYTPNPLYPNLQLVLGLTGVASFYSSDDAQTTLRGSVSLVGQFGNFSRDFFDYTSFNLTYSEALLSGESPFLFDRVADRQVISGGILQQIYGPLRFGVQTSYNPDRDEEIDTDFVLDYSRRTYSIILRVNPIRQIGSLNLQINDFNWGGLRPTFSGTRTEGSVTDGVIRRQE